MNQEFDNKLMQRYFSTLILIYLPNREEKYFTVITVME